MTEHTTDTPAAQIREAAGELLAEGVPISVLQVDGVSELLATIDRLELDPFDVAGAFRTEARAQWGKWEREGDPSARAMAAVCHTFANAVGEHYLAPMMPRTARADAVRVGDTIRTRWFGRDVEGRVGGTWTDGEEYPVVGFAISTGPGEATTVEHTPDHLLTIVQRAAPQLPDDDHDGWESLAQAVTADDRLRVELEAWHAGEDEELEHVAILEELHQLSQHAEADARTMAYGAVAAKLTEAAEIIRWHKLAAWATPEQIASDLETQAASFRARVAIREGSEL